MKNSITFFVFFLALHLFSQAQPVMTTGGKKMPDEWMDSATRHKVVRLSRVEGNNLSFYFHNNPFYKNRMVFYNTVNGHKQLYTVDLKTLKNEKITSQANNMTGEIVGHKTGNVYYQVDDSVFSTNIETKQTKLLYVFPSDYQGSITTINADETLFAGAKASDEQKEIRKNILRRASSSTASLTLICRMIFLLLT
jgi:oligogalacturonide lyase